MGIGDEYQEQTKYHRENLGGGLRSAERAVPYKYYENPVSRIELEAPQARGGAGLWGILASRRSVRRFGKDELPMKCLVQLLWAMNGITLRGRDYEFRASPSAGALYPVETYFIANRIEGLEPGLYHHDVYHNRLDFLFDGYIGDAVAQAALGQKMCERAAATFVWTAIPARSKWKYRERAYRYIYMDAGIIGQNFHLAAEAMNLACCMIGAFFDDEMNEILGVDGRNESAIYLAVVGMKE